MGFTLNKVVPWGRSYEEYVDMFSLTEWDLGLRILGCGDGPAAFNSKLTDRGGRVVSVDPIYAFDSAQIKSRIDETYEVVMAQLLKNQGDYVWNNITSVEKLGEMRISAMNDFLTDFTLGKHEGRYVTGELPLLPFGEGQFDIALSSHFLFLYSSQLTSDFHIKAIREMLRVAHEVRIFPLVSLDGSQSQHLRMVVDHFSDNGFNVKTMCVPYEFQRGGNEMLVINSELAPIK